LRGDPIGDEEDNEETEEVNHDLDSLANDDEAQLEEEATPREQKRVDSTVARIKSLARNARDSHILRRERQALLMGRQNEIYSRQGAPDPVRMTQSTLPNLLEGAEFYNDTARAKLQKEKALPQKKKQAKETKAQKEQNDAKERGQLAASLASFITTRKVTKPLGGVIYGPHLPPDHPLAQHRPRDLTEAERLHFTPNEKYTASMDRAITYQDQEREVHTLGDCRTCGMEAGQLAIILCDGDPDHEDTFCNMLYHIKCLGKAKPDSYPMTGFLGPCCRPIIRPYAHTPEHATRSEWSLQRLPVPRITEIPEHRPTQRRTPLTRTEKAFVRANTGNSWHGDTAPTGDTVTSLRGEFMNRTHTVDEREEAYAKRGPRIPKTRCQLNTAQCVDTTLLGILEIAAGTGTDCEKTTKLEDLADDNECESQLLDDLFEIGGVTRNASLPPGGSARTELDDDTPALGRDWHKLRTKVLGALEPKYRSRTDRTGHSPSLAQTFCLQIITLTTIVTRILPTLARTNAATRSRRHALNREASARSTRGLTPELLNGYAIPDDREYDNDIDEPTSDTDSTPRRTGPLSRELRPLVGTEDPPREGVG
jgi:hypothetical protein